MGNICPVVCEMNKPTTHLGMVIGPWEIVGSFDPSSRADLY